MSSELGLDNTLNEPRSWNGQLHPIRAPVTLSLSQGHTLLLTGPARIMLSEGRGDCYGAPIGSDTWIAVEALQQLPFFATDGCVFEIRPESQSSWKEVSESTIPTGWMEGSDVVQRQRGVAVVVGNVDSGKSSLCTFLVNKCIQDGLRVGVVDADVGQADIGPAATISSARVSGPVLSLQELEAECSYFIGDTSPSLVSAKLIRLLVSLARGLVNSVDVTFVNTDGWIGDPAALRFKDELIRAVGASLVLGLGEGKEVDSLLDVVSSTSMRLSSSKYARTRSKEERKRAREAGYRRFLLGASPLSVNQGGTSLRMFDRPEQTLLRWNRAFKGFLAGLLDADERLLGIGRIREISDRDAVVETKATQMPRFLEIGNIALSSKYEETGYGVLH